MADKMMRIAGRTSSGVAKPFLVDNNGNVGTTRTWEKTWVTIQENVEIRDTSEHNLTVFDSSGVPMLSLRILNRLKDSDNNGVPVTVRFLTDVNTSNGYGFVDTDGANKSITIQPTNGYVVITPEELPLLNYVRYIRLSVKAQSTPTSGVVSAYAVTIS